MEKSNGAHLNVQSRSYHYCYFMAIYVCAYSQFYRVLFLIVNMSQWTICIMQVNNSWKDDLYVCVTVCACVWVDVSFGFMIQLTHTVLTHTHTHAHTHTPMHTRMLGRTHTHTHACTHTIKSHHQLDILVLPTGLDYRINLLPCGWVIWHLNQAMSSCNQNKW